MNLQSNVVVNTQYEWLAMYAAHELCWHHGSEGIPLMAVEQSKWTEMCVIDKGKVKMMEQWEKISHLYHDEPRQCLSISHPWPQVRMSISYLPKTVDRYHVQLTPWENPNRCTDARPPIEWTVAKVADILHTSGNLSVQNPRTCGCGWRSREQEKDWYPPQTLQYLADHCNHIPCHCVWSIWTCTQTHYRCPIKTQSLLRQTERDVEWLPTYSAVGSLDHLSTNDLIFTLPTYVWARCSTFNWTLELTVEYLQLDPRNQRHSVTACS